jgi:hypothetical protein
LRHLEQRSQAQSKRKGRREKRWSNSEATTRPSVAPLLRGGGIVTKRTPSRFRSAKPERCVDLEWQP